MQKLIFAIRYTFLLALVAHVQTSLAYFDLQEKHAALSADQSFQIFDLNESPENIEFLESLVVKNCTSPTKPIVLNHYGDLENFEYQVTQLLISCGNSEQDAVQGAEIIHRIAANCLTAMNLPEAWIAIRAFEPNNMYDVQRWHIDSEHLFSLEPEQLLLKVVCSLKGPSTLLCNVPAATRKEFFTTKAQKYPNNLSLRTAVAQIFEHYTIESAAPGQGVIFIMGNDTIGAIHSEPKIDRPRIFMSIIAGSHEQIQNLYKRWHHSIESRF